MPARTNVRSRHSAPLTRSSSTGVLNQSDSDQEQSPKMSSRQSLMRPTISSQNKQSNPKTNSNRRRIPQSISTSKKTKQFKVKIKLKPNFFVVNLSTVGQEDSSSEETPPQTNGKPAVPPRPRSIAIDHQQPLATPRRHVPIIKDKSKGDYNIFKNRQINFE